MTDTLTPRQRHRCMSAVQNKNTTPELAVRRVLRAAGTRYRGHRMELPGTPDFVLTAEHTVIMVHGCFWHTHICRKGSLSPATRCAFWRQKRAGNRARDRKVRSELRRLGWQVITVWECQTRNADRLKKRLTSLIRDSQSLKRPQT